MFIDFNHELINIEKISRIYTRASSIVIQIRNDFIKEEYNSREEASDRLNKIVLCLKNNGRYVRIE